MLAAKQKERTERTERTAAFAREAVRTSGDESDPDRIVRLLRSWDTDGDGIFSVDEVAEAARMVLRQKKKGRGLQKAVCTAAILYAVTIPILFGVTLGAMEMAKDFRPDDNSILLSTRGDRNVIRTKRKIYVQSPFEMASKSLADLERVDSIYIDDLLAGNGEVLQRFYKVEMITKAKASENIKVAFFGGDYLEVTSERALLFRPKPAEGCGEAKAADTPDGYCPVAEIVNGPDPREEQTRRRLATTAIPEPLYPIGPRNIGGNVYSSFNTGSIYESDGIVSLGRSRFFAQHQQRFCQGPTCT
ncbi:unnamed protein product [Vitrella brassicaformis CCMP3155]|uniref:EF-hand domain-containing protein n=1 Tax=Vitrella brassicaformis (strain CCMP3155) TaxID=1169540 RepID=A0A0G4EGV1_VITBC|nr:unnamed protein product [Vitrella brassicaformis CCMP3155]|mmetsp:Transcript_16540/g.39713  ORF Transcript_16540/g.39713 Transcript_16540/m.39713 type:complete len:303 (-) Transcript_16540:572-1480(-)|eukprot:CEL94594.1 unnamed protein product [Vitrella brassicaformis CCMP3155]